MASKQKTRTWDSLGEALKVLIRETDNFYRLEKETGVQRGSMMRLVRGERSLQLPFADKLAQYFKLKVIKED